MRAGASRKRGITGSEKKVRRASTMKRGARAHPPSHVSSGDSRAKKVPHLLEAPPLKSGCMVTLQVPPPE